MSDELPVLKDVSIEFVDLRVRERNGFKKMMQVGLKECRTRVEALRGLGRYRSSWR